MNSEEYAKKELIEGLRLVACNFEVQRSLLPDFVHLPDEILNAAPIDQLEFLVESKVFTQEQAAEIRKFDSYLDSVELPEDYEEMVELVKSSKSFESVRQEARRLLNYLGAEIKSPDLGHIQYVRGM